MGEVERPVVVEVVVAADGSELEDGFGAVESPAGAGDVHAVLDEVAARALDDAGGDRPALVERGRVVEEVRLVREVGGGAVGVGALAAGQLVVGGFAADRGGNPGGVALEDLGGLVCDPGLGVGVAFVVEL